MTTRKRSGTEDSGTIEGIENLKAGEGVEGYEYASSLSTEGTQLIDPAFGKTVSIRTFEFSMNPAMIKHFPTDKQQIFNAHAKQIQTMLWADGLRPLDEVGPRVIINTKKKTYQIFVPCEARLNQLFIEKPKSLSEQLKPHGSKRH